MQNTATLTDLGFTKITSSKQNEYLFRGKHQKFIAKVIDCNGPLYVALFHCGELGKDGHTHYRLPVRECYKDGSVEAALTSYDLPESLLYRDMCGTRILNKD